MAAEPKPCSQCAAGIPGDSLFCDECGWQLFELRIEPRGFNFYIDPAKEAPRGKRLLVVTGDWGVPRLECEDPPGWLRFDSQDRILWVDPSKLAPMLEIDEFPVTMRVRGADTAQEILVSVAPPPAIEIRPLTVVGPAGGPAGEVRAKLDLVAYCPMIVEKVSFDPEWLEYKASGRLELRRGMVELPISARVGGAGRAPFEALCTVKVLGWPEPVKARFKGEFKEPPNLHVVEIDEEHDYPILVDGEGEIVLHFTNGGSETALWIDNIDVQPVSEQARAISFTVEPARLSVQPGLTVPISFHARRCSPVRNGHYKFQLSIDSNAPAPQNQKELWVKVSDEAYLQFIAVDFGTIDSAIACFNPTLREKSCNLLLERDSHDPKIYSNIFFEDYLPDREPPYSWLIGRKALMLGEARGARRRLIRAAKTKIDTKQKLLIQFPGLSFINEIDPEDAVQYVLMDLLRRTRDNLRKKPAKFVMCVPTRFTLRKKRILESIFRKAAAAVSLRVSHVVTIDESLAAGLFSFRSGAMKGRGGASNVMIVDFGGGTTDVTVFRAHWDPGQSYPVQVEIIGAWGDPELGGEGITREISDLLLSRFGGPAKTQPEREAESLKIVVSELDRRIGERKADRPDELLTSLDESLRLRIGYLCLLNAEPPERELHAILEKYLKSGEISVVSVDFGAGMRPATVSRDEIVEIYRRKLGAFKEGLVTLLGKIGLDKVDELVLAGQSSLFPTVAEVLKDLALSWDFVRDAGAELLLKECVSLGAVSLVGEELEIAGQHRLWTRLGYYRAANFKELVPWGTDYSKEFFASFTVDHLSVEHGWLVVQIWEATELEGDEKILPFGTFRLELEDPTLRQYNCRLALDTEGAVKMYGQAADGPWREMEWLA